MARWQCHGRCSITHFATRYQIARQNANGLRSRRRTVCAIEHLHFVNAVVLGCRSIERGLFGDSNQSPTLTAGNDKVARFNTKEYRIYFT